MHQVALQIRQRRDDLEAPGTGSTPALPIYDRLFVIAGLAGIVAVSWAYLAIEAGRMGDPSGGMTKIMELHPRDTTGLALLFLMWTVMMVAMMLPSASPLILMFATVNRKQRDAGRPYVATSIFALGYLAAWAGFSLVAVILQW